MTEAFGPRNCMTASGAKRNEDADGGDLHVPSTDAPRRWALAAFTLLPIAIKRRVLFRRAHGYRLPRSPETFSEKVQWRIIRDRRPLIALTGDKLRMKEYATERSTSVLVPETLWSGTDLTPILDRDWGCRWILKPISGTGSNVAGSGSLRDAGVDSRTVQGWNYDAARRYGEWAYSRARSGYLLERFIETPEGGSPQDLKFYVFGGRVRVIYVSAPADEGGQHRFYTPAWEPTAFRRPEIPLAAPQTAPPNLERLITIAEEIGAEYDFIRVDLYDTDAGVFFGELTPYPAGGLRRFDPPSADRELGALWHLDPAARRGTS